MKTALVLALLTIVHPAFAKKPPVKKAVAPAAGVLGGQSKITEVTLFQDRAYVRRRQTVNVPKGAFTVAFTGVTPTADLESLKVQLGERKNLTLMSVRTEQRFSVKAANPELAKLQERQQALRNDVQALVNRCSTLNEENHNLSLLMDHYAESFSLNLHQKEWSRAQLGAFVSFLVARSGKMNAAWQKHFAEFQKVQKELEAVDARALQLSSASDRHDITVLVDVLADAPATTPVEVQYLVTNAGWSPTYDLRIDPGEGKATIEMNAFAWQKSGEDWDGVKLTLSKVRSELRPEVPTIERNILSYVEAGKVKTVVHSKKDDVTALHTGGQGGEGEEGEGLAKNFVIPSPQTVRSGLTRTRIAIDRKETPYQEALELVPSQYAYVYRKGELKNPYPWNLAPGPMNLYYRGAFQQQTAFRGIARGDRFGVNAGVDHDVRVRREYRDKEREPGMLGTKQTYVRTFVTSLENFSAKAKKLRLLDQTPVSELASVEVRMESTLGKGKEETPGSGWYAWDVKLDPREEKSVELTVSVACPKDFAFAWD